VRETILDIAQELIQRRGVNGMSYADISKAVDIRKASIHHHFPSKEDLVNAVLKRYQSNFHTSLNEILTSSVKPKKKLQRFMKLFEATIAQGSNDKACLCGMLSAELFSLSEETADLVREFLNDCRETISKILKEGLEDESFNVSGNVSNMSDLFLATLEGGLFMARVDGGPERRKTAKNRLLGLNKPFPTIECCLS